MTLQVITVPETTQILKGDDAQALHIISISETPSLDIVTEENSEVQVVAAADSLWVPDGTGYIRPKSNMKVKGENVEIDISGNARALFFQVDGELEPSTNLCPLIIPFGLTITEIKVKLSEAPIGASVILDLHKNGTSIYTTQANRPTIISGETTALITLPDEVNLIEDDELVLDIDQVGSTAPGTGLTMTLMCGDMFNYSEFTEAQLLALKGEPGQAGEDGVSVPAGGTTDQVLAKASAADHDFKWIYMNGVKSRIYVPFGTPNTNDDEFDDGSISTDWTNIDVEGLPNEWYEPSGLKGLSCYVPAGKGAWKLCGKVKPIGALTYPCYIETAIKINGRSTGYPGAGVVFSTSNAVGAGTQLHLAYHPYHNMFYYGVYTNFTSRGNLGELSVLPYAIQDYLHIRLVWKNANTFSCYFSLDGVVWYPAFIDIAVTLTPAYMGISESSEDQSAYPFMINYGYFRARSGSHSNG